MNRSELETIIREIIAEKAAAPCPIKLGDVPQVAFSEADRLDTGDPASQVFTRDLFSLTDSPRLGAGVMEMTATTFPWKLDYDEVDYIIDGELTIYCGKTSVTAKAGQALVIPKGSKILFSAPRHARFLYVTYPADWQS